MSGFIRLKETQDRHIDFVRARLGSLINKHLDEACITDICLDPPRAGDSDGKIWVSGHGIKPRVVGTMTPGDAERLIASVAGALFQEVTVRNPYVEGELNVDGSRFSGGMPPMAPGPFFAIRKKSSMVWPLQWWVDRGCLEEWQKVLIERTLKDRQNIIIAGGMGSGKTSFLNAVLEAAGQQLEEEGVDERFLVLEETMELQFSSLKHVLSLRATPEMTLQKLLHAALRQNGTRIMLGEVRGGEALELLKSWNTGHGGCACTIHADVQRPDAALDRLEVCVMEACNAPMKRLIANAVNLIVCMEPDKRVGQIVRVQAYDSKRDDYVLRTEHR